MGITVAIGESELRREFAELKKNVEHRTTYLFKHNPSIFAAIFATETKRSEC